MIWMGISFQKLLSLVEPKKDAKFVRFETFFNPDVAPGQKQKWYIMRFNGEDSEINIKTKKPEFFEWKWESNENLTNVVVPFKLNVYKKIQQEVNNIIFKN